MRSIFKLSLTSFFSVKKKFIVIFLKSFIIYNFTITKKENSMILKFKDYLFTFFNNSFYFFKRLENNSLGLVFLFIEKYYFFSFLEHMSQAYIYLFKIFFCRLKLRGLGYSLRRYNRFFFRFFMAVSNFFYFHVPDSIFLKKRKKYLVLVSYNKMQLNLLFWNLLFIKKHNVYSKLRRLSGFIKPNFLRSVKKK